MGIRKLSAGVRASTVFAGVVGMSGLCFNGAAAAQGQIELVQLSRTGKLSVRF